MRRGFAPVPVARREGEASVGVLESRRGAAEVPGSAVPGCYAAFLRRRAQCAQCACDRVRGVDWTEGHHGDTRGPSWGEDERRAAALLRVTFALFHDGVQVAPQARVRAVVTARLQLGDLERRVGLTVTPLDCLQLAADAVDRVVPSRGHAEIHGGGKA